MINFKRPLGLMPLLSVIATLTILTSMLAAMVWSRISLLQNGSEIVLKTAPIDPRDLLRGYFVRLSYDIGRIAHNDLEVPVTEPELGDGYKRRSTIFVKLRPDREGFWGPVSLHRTRPVEDSRSEPTSPTVIIRGKILYGSCSRRLLSVTDCKVSIRYGIEKFFAAKQRSKKLEDFGRQISPELKEMRKKIASRQKEYRRMIREHRQTTDTQDKRVIMNNINNQPEIKQIREELADLRRDQAQLAQQNNKNMAKRFAVIVRVDKQSGEAAISGLQIDGKRIYDERLF